jgi:uncharacterized damage-inducible protein DinB
MTTPITENLRALLLRDVRALRREIEAYPDEKQLWAVPGGVKNSAGTLALHLAGNVQHFIGAKLGDTSYVRNRDAEFAQRDVPRAKILSEIDAAAQAIETGFAKITDADLSKTYGDQVAGLTFTTGEWLLHIVIHLGYHLGQIDYHRRIVTGDSTTLDVVSVKEVKTPG